MLLHRLIEMLPRCTTLVYDQTTLRLLGWQWLPGLAKSLHMKVKEMSDEV